VAATALARQLRTRGLLATAPRVGRWRTVLGSLRRLRRGRMGVTSMPGAPPRVAEAIDYDAILDRVRRPQ
jgi:hypothetical protein